MALFSKSKPKKGPANSAAALKAQAQTPAATYEQGARKFAEIYGSSMVASGRMFVVAVIALLLAILSVGAVMGLTPLKEVAPYVIEVNTASGLASKPIEVQKISPNIAVVKSELAKWAESVYAIDPLRTRELYQYANVRARGKAIAQFSEFRSRERTFERLQKEPGLVREVQVSSVDASQSGVAFVFLKTVERTGNQLKEENRTRRFRLTIHYQLDPPTQEAELFANPLGVYVNFFNESEEKAQ